MKVPPVKSPEERGEPAAWAIESRGRLGLSDAQVAHRIERAVNPATIRKAEADSKNMSRPLWRQLVKFYTEEARRQNVALPPLPSGPAKVAAEGPAVVEEIATLLRQQNALLGVVIAELQTAAGDREAVFRILARLEAALPPVDAPASDEPLRVGGSRS